MKTYLVEVQEKVNEELVADILAALQKRGIIAFAEFPASSPAMPALADFATAQDTGRIDL